MSAVIVIPARYDSTRFPGKPLALLKGKPVIQHVYENSKKAVLADEIVVATDSETIFEKVLAFGGRAVMTDRNHVSGTDRVAEVAKSLDCDIIVNVQADEPLIKPEMIDDVIRLLSVKSVKSGKSDRQADMGTLVRKIERAEEIIDPNTVKAVFDREGFAFYFSRAPIPYHRDEWRDLNSVQRSAVGSVRPTVGSVQLYKHIGIYSYRRDVLLRLAEMEPTRLEEIEKLEQLRALENGFRIKVKETLYETIGVDTPQDLEKVEKWLSLSL